MYGTSDFMTVFYPTFRVILLVTGNKGRGAETTGKIRQIEIRENSLIY
jgi:hypothetical protein